MGELIQMMKSVLFVRANCAKFTVKFSYLCSCRKNIQHFYIVHSEKPQNTYFPKK